MKVRCVQFGLLSPDDIKNFSVGEIKSHEKFDARGFPKEAGLMDAHLGVPPRAGYRCKTCQGDDMTCPGHFGHINLVKPCFHCGMLTILQKLLSCACHKCGMLLSDENDVNFRAALRIKHPQARLSALAAICKGKKVCKHEPLDKSVRTRTKRRARGKATTSSLFAPSPHQPPIHPHNQMHRSRQSTAAAVPSTPAFCAPGSISR